MRPNKTIAIMDSFSLYGKERANINVYHILEENGVDLTVFYNERSSSSLIEELADFKKVSLPFPRNFQSTNRFFKLTGYLRNWMVTNFLLFKFINKEKVSHVLVPTEIALLYLYIPLFFSKVKVVLRLGDDPINVRKRSSKYVSVYSFIWKKLIINQVYHCVSISKYINNNLLKSGRSHLLHNSIIYNIPPKRKKYLEINDMSKVRSKVCTFGFIGRVVPEKGVKELVLAVLELLSEGFNFKLIVAGDLEYDNAYSRGIFSVVSNSNFANKFEFIGEVSNVESFYQTIDVLCVPSVYNEPLSNVICEAKVYRKPSIILRRGGMPELIDHLETGYICDDVLDLKAGLLFYIKNQFLIDNHGQMAYNSIVKLGLDKEYFRKSWISVFLAN